MRLGLSPGDSKYRFEILLGGDLFHFGQTEFFEIVEAEALDTSALVKKPLGAAKLPDGVVVGAIVRGDQVIIPRADTRIRPQDSVVLFATRQAVKDGLMGVSFHVGSQCMRPTAYQAAMAQVGRSISRAGVIVDIVDVGGGFPSVYPGMVPPDMQEYADAIHRGFNEMPVSETTELWCEPGRALVAESSSVLARVELRKGDALYLNDGSYGSLFDATHSRWPFPTKLVRDGEASSDLKPFRFYGPTCDSIDHMPGPFWLPADVQEGDFIEIGMLGAYGVAMSTGFNGYGEHDIAGVEDAPMASLYGLAPRSIPTVRTSAEEQARKVVRLSRPKGKAGQRKQRRR